MNWKHWTTEICCTFVTMKRLNMFIVGKPFSARVNNCVPYNVLCAHFILIFITVQYVGNYTEFYGMANE